MLAVCRFLLHHVLKREKQGMQGRDKRKLIKEAQPKKRCPVFSILLAVWRLIFMPYFVKMRGSQRVTTERRHRQLAYRDSHVTRLRQRE